MNYILSISFANERVAEKSYENLAETSGDEQVIILDNHYPLRRQFVLKDICERYRFHYIDAGYNMGLYDGWNFLLETLPMECKSVILHDGDNFLLNDGWTGAIFDVLEDGTVGNCIVSNDINYRELHERGFESETINGHKVRISKQAICCTVGGWSVPFLRSIGGITAPHKYYGGNEVHMWKYYQEQGKKLVVLEDFHEELDSMKSLQDAAYQEYKIRYAHQGMNISFDKFLESGVPLIGVDVLLKQIFG